MKNATEVDGGLVWRGGAYNDGNGCGAGATFFPLPALKLTAAFGVRGGICNVMVKVGPAKTFFPLPFMYVRIFL